MDDYKNQGAGNGAQRIVLRSLLGRDDREVEPDRNDDEDDAGADGGREDESTPWERTLQASDGELLDQADADGLPGDFIRLRASIGDLVKANEGVRRKIRRFERG